MRFLNEGWRVAAVVALLAAFGGAAQGEITSISGRVEARVQEFRGTGAGDSDVALDRFPATSSTLPLQVVGQLIAPGDEVAAARVGAQFADPRSLNQANPEEFAINLALNSVTETRYEASALTEETREVTFQPADTGLANGARFVAVGKVFVDGALAVYSVSPEKDLTGAFVTLTVTVVRRVAGQPDATVFSGELGIDGAAGGDANVRVSGAFPVENLVLSDLSAVSPDFAAFHVLIIPPQNLEYEYDAVVGEAFALVATVTISAANLGGECGVAALVGTPVDSLQRVIEATKDDQTARRFVDEIGRERANPSGDPAFPLDKPRFGLCGLFGLELAAVPAMLAAGRRWALRAAGRNGKAASSGPG